MPGQPPRPTRWCAWMEMPMPTTACSGKPAALRTYTMLQLSASSKEPCMGSMGPYLLMGRQAQVRNSSMSTRATNRFCSGQLALDRMT